MSRRHIFLVPIVFISLVPAAWTATQDAAKQEPEKPAGADKLAGLDEFINVFELPVD